MLGLQGLWQDSQIAGFKRVVDFVHAHKGKIGIQLAHAGRKASTLAPWVQRLANDGGWEGGYVPDAKAGGWAEKGEFGRLGWDRLVEQGRSDGPIGDLVSRGQVCDAGRGERRVHYVPQASLA